MVSVDINVDIYTVRLEAGATRLDSLYETLAPEERSRADRFHFAEHRLRFIACRGTLREVLSSYLKLSPERIAFAYNDQGKPYLPDSDVRFALAP
jgi:4'-phosphopantetheinyl transferase